MRVAVLGVGAMGSLLGGRLSAAGVQVTFVDRGERARVLAANGLTIMNPDGTLLRVQGFSITDTADSQQPHDVVILAVKAHEIAAALPILARLLHEDTTVVTMQNGIPWWYFQGLSGPLAGRTIEAVDPGGRISEAIDISRILGCVAYPAAEVLPLGTTRHVEGYRFPIGELDGASTARARAISGLLVSAGFKAPIIEDIRSEIWLKNWGNLCFNPVSALTRATMAGICRVPEARAIIAQMMREVQQIAEQLGIGMRVSLERRLQGAAQVGEHKTSMLQDVEAGRPLEIEALVGATLELARLAGVEAPTIKTVYALAKLLNETSATTLGAGRAEPINAPAEI